MSTQTPIRGLGRRARRLSLAAIALAIAATLLPTEAMATTAPSVEITSPMDGDVLSMYADWTDPTVAEAPLEVTFVAEGFPVTCSLDGQTPFPCISPTSFERVGAGEHTVTVSAGTATQTNSFTVQTVALAPPPQLVIVDGPYFRPVTVKNRWKIGQRRTFVRLLELRHMPRHVRVHVVCSGTGCPSPHRFCRRASDHLDLTRFFRGHALRPGTRIVIRVMKSGRHIRTFRYTIRRNARPSVVVS